MIDAVNTGAAALQNNQAAKKADKNAADKAEEQQTAKQETAKQQTEDKIEVSAASTEIEVNIQGLVEQDLTVDQATELANQLKSQLADAQLSIANKTPEAVSGLAQ